MKPEERDLWPPKFWKFLLITDGPALEVAFTDPRRFGRVRLIDCPAAEIRKLPPLSENGPDPVVDTKAFTYEFFLGKTRSRHVPIKALLLDQAMISGIGNWVGDEVLFHARLHPEQYCDEFDDGQIRKLYDSIRYVCQTAVDKLGDSDEFPSDWLFKHRWDKGSKGATSTLPNGEKLAFITVGGRTSCYAPALQKKTGQITAGAKEAPLVSAEQPREKKVPSRKRKSDLSQTAGSNESQKRGKRSEPHGTLYKKAQDSRDDQLISKLGSPEAGRRRSGRVKAQSQRDKEGTR
jgi:formamidopyrimidine-DNA glycosylase